MTSRGLLRLGQLTQHLSSPTSPHEAPGISKSTRDSNTNSPEKSNDPGHKSKSESRLLHSLSSKKDDEIVKLVLAGKLSHHKLERALKRSVKKGFLPDCTRAVRIRRLMLSLKLGQEAVKTEPANDDPKEQFQNLLQEMELPCFLFKYDDFYLNVMDKHCENVIGYVPVPIGFAGPLLLNNKSYYVPMATTEGALVASTNRGARAITESGGATAYVYDDGMTRSPVVQMPSIKECAQLKTWLNNTTNFKSLQNIFASTTSFGKLKKIEVMLAGRLAYLRFKCTTGDAMGMNMVTKGVKTCMRTVEKKFPKMKMLSISGNACTDKKPSAINWIDGRGKSVTSEVILSAHAIIKILKCTAASLVEVNHAKNLVGSSVAGSIGGNNAQAANIITACFLATGQDVAQVVESSTCLTLMETTPRMGVRVSVTLPSLEVATVGGGTGLKAQKACLKVLGLAGPTKENEGPPGTRACQLAKVFAATVLAGEISLMSALASRHLVDAHMKLNRGSSPI